MAPPVGWVQISSTDPPVLIVCRLGDARPNMDDGYGGWEQVARPRRPPITTWVAPPGRQMTLSLLLDEFASGASLESQIANLEKLGRPSASDGEPPQVKITAAGGMVPHQELTWIVQTLAFGDPAEANQSGNRTRQQVTLTLLEWIEDIYLAQRSAANRRRAKAKAKKKKKPGAAAKRKPVKKKKATAKKKARVDEVEFDGEDLLSIAARELGDADRWLEIAELNGIRDPRSLVEGQVIRLP